MWCQEHILEDKLMAVIFSVVNSFINHHNHLNIHPNIFCAVWLTSRFLWCLMQTLDTTFTVSGFNPTWQMISERQYITRSMFSGKSAHGAADTDMAGLLGQLQVSPPYLFPSISLFPSAFRFSHLYFHRHLIVTEISIKHLNHGTSRGGWLLQSPSPSLSSLSSLSS